MKSIIKTIAPTLAAASMLLGVVGVHAQSYPSQPIRVINQYGAGGNSDLVMRALARELSGGGWPSVVVENRPGASGTVAAIATLQSPPDGYTLMSADTASHALSTTLVENLPFDPVNDFTPIMRLWTFPTVLTVPAESSIETVEDLIERAHTKPGGLSYGSQGAGTAGHILGYQLEKAIDVPMTHIPYQGGAQVIQDLLAGALDFAFSSIGSVMPQVESGDLRILANSADRQLAGVPSMVELGYPEVHYNVWFGLVGPAGLDPEVVDALNARARQAFESPELLEFMDTMGVFPSPSTPEEFRALIAADIEGLAPLMEELMAAQN